MPDMSMFDKVNDLDVRVITLEEAERERDEVDRLREERIKRLEDNATKLENTVMVESRETRATVVEQNRQLMTVLQSVMGFKTTANTQDHEFRLMKWDKTTNLALKVLGAGGIVYFIIQQIVTG
jgi:hypothetical protein